MNLSYGTPHTFDQEYPFFKDKLLKGKSDIVLEVIPIKNYWKWDMIEDDRIKEIVTNGKAGILIKPIINKGILNNSIFC